MNLKPALEMQNGQDEIDLFGRKRTEDDYKVEPVSQADPEGKGAREMAGANAYICLIHPQIHRVAAGVCPICHIRLKQASVPALDGSSPG